MFRTKVEWFREGIVIFFNVDAQNVKFVVLSESYISFNILQ